MTKRQILPAIIVLFAMNVSITMANPTATNEASAMTTKNPAYTDVTAVLSMQADAWNRGDLDAFMTGYLPSPETSYTSGGTEVWGYEALRERYRTKYGDNKESMGKLRFSDLKTTMLGKDNALCIGHWHLDRDGKPQLNGIFSLVLAHTNSGWKVLHDHTSVINP